MSLEQALNDHAAVIKELIDTLNAINATTLRNIVTVAPPQVKEEEEEKASVSAQDKVNKAVKAEKPKAEKKAAKKPEPVVEPEPEEEAEAEAEDDDYDFSEFEEVEPEVTEIKLPAGKRDLEYYAEHVQPYLQKIAEANIKAGKKHLPTLMQLVKTEFKAPGKADTIPPKQWDALVNRAADLLAELTTEAA